MALIDLSKIDANIPGMPAEKQIFSTYGAETYKAAAKLGHGVSDVITELYAKQQDVLTDRESNDAIGKYKTTMALTATRAEKNINSNTGFVIDEDGNDTGKTYDQYMNSIRTDLTEKVGGGLNQLMSKNKFYDQINNWNTNQDISDIFTTSKKMTEDSVNRFQKAKSASSDTIRLSDSLHTVSTLDQAWKDLTPHLDVLQKTGGVVARQTEEEKAKKEFIYTAADAVLINGETDPRSLIGFAETFGIQTIFKNGKEYGNYVMKTLTDDPSSGELSENELNQLGASIELDYNTHIGTPPHPFASSLSAQEKDMFLKKWLNIKIHNEKKNIAGLDTMIKNWTDRPANKSFNLNTDLPKYAAEYGSLMASSDKHPAIKLGYIQEATNSIMQGEMNKNYALYGKAAFSNTVKESLALKNKIAGTLEAASGLTSKEIADAKGSFPSTSIYSASDTASLEKSQAKMQERFHTTANSTGGGDKILSGLPEYTNGLKKSFKLVKDGIVINEKELKSFSNWRKGKLNQVGSASAQISSTELLTNPYLNDLYKYLDVIPAESKRDFMAGLNKTSPEIATAFNTQLIKDRKVSVEEAVAFTNMKFDNPEGTKTLESKWLEIKNKFAGEETKKWIEQMELPNALWGSSKFSDISKTAKAEVDANIQVQGMKEIALASGLPSDQIQAMFKSDMIQKAVLLDVREHQEAYTGIKGKFTPTSGIVRDSIDRVMKNIYGHLTPVNEKSLKVMAPSTDIEDIAPLSKKSDDVVNNVMNNIKSGQLKLDMSAFIGSIKGEKYNKIKGLSEEAKAKLYFKDINNSSLFGKKENFAFVSKDLNGKIGELSLMYKDSNSHTYKLVKLIDSKGRSYNPTLGSVQELKNGDASSIYNKLFNR